MMTLNRKRAYQYLVQDGHLIRSVAGDGGGSTYTHRCKMATFEAVAHAIAEMDAEWPGVTVRHIVATEKLPFTQVHIAMEFLKERGIVEVRYRRYFPASSDVHLDAMVEFHALAERCKHA